MIGRAAESSDAVLLHAMRSLMTALESLYDTEKSIAAADADRREVLRRQLCHHRRSSPANLAVQVRERMERAIFNAEQDVVEWPLLPQPAHCAQAANHILRLTRGGQSAPDPRRPARADSTPDWEAAVFVATDANDAWVLSVMVYHLSLIHI